MFYFSIWWLLVLCKVKNECEVELICELLAWNQIEARNFLVNSHKNIFSTRAQKRVWNFQ